MKRKQVYLFFFLCVCFLILMACGKKGPPFLPESNVSLKVEQLKGTWKNGAVILTGSVPLPQGQKKGTADITGCIVHHSLYAFETPPCDGCPVEYRTKREIQAEVVKGDKFRCEIPEIKRGWIHFFKVCLISRKGGTGPSSNRVKLALPSETQAE